MDYIVKLESGKDGGTGSARIVGLPDIYLHFGYLNFDIVWNPTTRQHETVRGVDRFFGGMGEGSAFTTWQDAIHASLYDAFQVYDELNDGDTFTAEYNGEVAKFICDGVHVVKVGA